MHEKFFQEWHTLQRNWQMATRETEEWDRRVKNSQEHINSSNPELGVLVKEGQAICIQNEKMKELIEYHESNIKSRAVFLENAERVSQRRIRQATLDEHLEKLRYLISKGKFKRKPISPIVKTAIEGILKAADMTRAKMQAYVAEADNLTKQEIERLNGQMESNESRCQAIETECAGIVQEFIRQENEKVAMALKNKRLCREALIAWATQDREHLEWTLANTTFAKHELVKAYKERFPQEDITQFTQAPTMQESQVSTPQQYLRSRAKESDQQQAPQSQEERCRPWQFLFCISEEDSGLPLPADRTAFGTQLEALLDEPSLQGVHGVFVWEKLMLETERIDKGLPTSPKVVGHKFNKWLETRVGLDYRMLILPNKQTRHMRFFLYPKKDHKRVLA